MRVFTEYHVIIKCDFCHEQDTYGWYRRKDAIAEARACGWSIGKKVRCPKCKSSRGKKEGDK